MMGDESMWVGYGVNWKILGTNVVILVGPLNSVDRENGEVGGD